MTTLTIIETPTSTALKINEPASDDNDVENKYLDTPASDDSSLALLFHKEKSLHGSLPVKPEFFIVKSKPITAKIRTTMKHLRARAGRRSGFRGILLAMIIRMLHSLVFTVLSILFYGPLSRVFAYVVADVVLAGLDMAWTHIVISAPSTRPWWRRIPSFDRVKVIIIPAAIFGVADASHLLPYLLAKAFPLEPYTLGRLVISAPDSLQAVFVAKYDPVQMVALISQFLIMIPATITLRRVQASMLPDEDEAIVPFDRTFGGKVQPVVIGGNGAVSMLDAWKTFDWSAYIRYLKLQLKVKALDEAAAIIIFWICIGENLVLFNEVGKQAMDSPNIRQ